jgi:hypothetical protein
MPGAPIKCCHHIKANTSAAPAAAAAAGGWGASDYHSCIGFNSCAMYMDGPPYSVVCPWLAVAGLLFTCE